MADDLQDEPVALIQALARYLSRSSLPANISIDRRLDHVAGIVEREAGRRHDELVSKLHRMDIEVQALELRLQRTETEKITEIELEKWIRKRIAWLIGSLAGVATIIGFVIALFQLSK